MERLFESIVYYLWKRRYVKKKGKGSRIHYTVSLRKPKSLTIGKGVKIKHHAMLKGEIIIGDYTNIYPYAELKTRNNPIKIGKNCHIHEFSVLLSIGGIEIGNDVRVSHHVSIIASEHIWERIDIPIRKQGMRGKGIIIEDDVLIGAGARILDGVRIGKGAIVGAGAVVTKDVKPYSIVAGIPAREIAKRGHPKIYEQKKKILPSR